MATDATRPIITFAFVKDEFDKTGDLVSGLVPLFGPIFAQMAGKTFSPTEFAGKVQAFYGLRMNPWVAEEWAPRFEQAGFLVGTGDKYNKSYICSKEAARDYPTSDEISAALRDLVDHIHGALESHKLNVSRSHIEHGVIERLKTTDFLNLILKPNIERKVGTTLRLPGTETSTPADVEGAIDYVLASRILELHIQNPDVFRLVSKIASGALVSEIVLNLRSPPQVGQKMAQGAIAYIDSPFLIDALDLGDKTQHSYATELLADLRTSGALLRTFEHNAAEIRGILTATLDNHANINAAVGTVAYRIRTDGNARTRAQATRANVVKKLASIGVTTVSLENATRGKEKHFPEERIDDLTSQIRPFGDIFSREVDALSIAGVARQVLSLRAVPNIMSLSALFITKNAGLAREASRFLVEQCNYNTDAASPFITDRQAAGIMWLALGGSAGDLPEQQLLANCATAVTPRRDVLSTVYKFLEETDTKSAAEFESLMAEDRCAHYVMDFTLGDAALVTPENAISILEQVKRHAVADIEVAYRKASEQNLAKERTRAEEEIRRIQATHSQKISALRAEANQQAEALAAAVSERDEKLRETAAALRRQEEANAEQSALLARAGSSVQQLEKSVLLRCARLARNRGFFIRCVLSFLIALVGGAVAAALALLGGNAGGKAELLMYIGGGVVVSSIVSTVLAWTTPDWMLGRIIHRIVEKRFRKALADEGALQLLDVWQVDIERGGAERVQ